MAYIPDDAVVRGIEDIMQGDCQFDSTQRSAQVSGVIRYDLDDELSQFVRYLRELGRFEPPQVFGRIDMV